jgi:cysteine desulfurase family protein (TIGR01976 family)
MQTTQNRPTPGAPTAAAIRARFPAFEREVNGETVAFFDGPGGTQVPASVADAIRDHLLHHNGNAGWNYPTSHETDAVVEAGRAAMAGFLGARADEVAFGSSMTTLTLRLSRALGRAIEPGDRVVVTELDHHANVDPWKALGAERGAEIRSVRIDPATGRLDMDDLADAVRGARILAIGAASNALGTLPDIPNAARLARDAGATVFVDAVHYAPHELVDVEALGADFLAVSPYKFYGPHSGVLWGRKERVEALELPRVSVSPDTSPERLETGTAAFEDIAGITAAVEFLAWIGAGAGAGEDAPGARGAAGAGDDGAPADGGAEPRGGHEASEGRAERASLRRRLSAAYRTLHQRSQPLFTRLWEGLQATDGVTLFGPPPGEPRTPTLGFAIDGLRPADAAGRLARHGLFLSHGDFYAATVIDRLGYRDRGGILRAGCAAYTTEDEIDRLVAGVRELAG